MNRIKLITYNILNSLTKGYYETCFANFESDSPWFSSTFNVWNKQLRNLLNVSLCDSQETKKMHVGTAWGWINDDRIFIFRWDLKPQLHINSYPPFGGMSDDLVFDFMQRRENRSAADLKQCMPVRMPVTLMPHVTVSRAGSSRTHFLTGMQVSRRSVFMALHEVEHT